MLNEYLNTETRRSVSSKGRLPINYRHIREKDTFYDAPQAFLDSLPQPLKDVQGRYRHTPKVRVTTDQKSGEVVAKIIKFRIQDLEIHYPRDAFDVRVSVSFEVNYPGPVELLVPATKEGVPSSRVKDRLSYLHQGISIDLTQVTSANEGDQQLHELELELDTIPLVEQGKLCKQGRANDYEPMVGVFLNYIRAINRAATGRA
jgi:hypothetical protein